jgi:hypothetical protein
VPADAGTKEAGIPASRALYFFSFFERVSFRRQEESLPTSPRPHA